MYWLTYLILNNKDAILSLPTEVKTIVLIALGLMFGSSIIRGAAKLLKFTVVAAVIYFACTTFGIL